MKVTQGKAEYMPITLTLETRHEAKALFGIVDKVESYRCDENGDFILTKNEASLLVFLSNLNTEGRVNL